MADRVEIGLWVLQGIVAALFLLAGFGHAIAYEQTRAQVAWVRDVPEMMVRVIGVAELAGAVGVILPRATRILPILTPIAAGALALVMLLAAGFHVTRAEWPNAGIVLAQGALAGAVAYGRFFVRR
jgi:uncharacterized membrane protein